MTDKIEYDETVKQFSLNLVSPSDKNKDQELRECLIKGLEAFTEIITLEKTQSFFAIVLDDSDSISIVAAGDEMPLKTLGAMESAKNELLRGL